jgi:Amt family ammonium transporter
MRVSFSLPNTVSAPRSDPRGEIANTINWYDANASPPGEVVYNPGDIAWVLASTALVWIMVPGVGFFYSGLLR